MSTTTITVPDFDGTEHPDVEDFISSIRKKAFAEGKQRDSAWILDVVAACLTRDALRWHATLDPAIQNDWTLLQKALLARFRPTFKGIDGEECEHFIHSLRRSAFEEGRDADNDWITRFVSTCVVGDALRWHSDLAPEIQSDWNLLQKALLRRYPPEDRDRFTKAPLVPIPAAAAPAPTGPKVGRVLLVDSTNPSVKRYLSRTLHAEGYITATQNTYDALLIDGPQGSGCTLSVKNVDGGYKFLGIKWYQAGVPQLTQASSSFARMVAIPQLGTTKLLSSFTIGQGAVHADIWATNTDGVLRMLWTDSNGAKTNLIPRFSSAGIVWVAGSASKNDSHTSTKATLVFEEA